MKNVMDNNRTVPGKFSVLKRSTEFKGETYHYPYYKTESVAHKAVQAIVDQYMDMLHDILH
jgi:hypothetical protein